MEGDFTKPIIVGWWAITLAWAVLISYLTVLLHKYGGIHFSFLVFSVLAFLVMGLSQSDNSAWKGHAG